MRHAFLVSRKITGKGILGAEKVRSRLVCAIPRRIFFLSFVMAGAFAALWALLKYGLVATISVSLAFAIIVHYTPQLVRQANAIRRLGRVVTGPLTGSEYRKRSGSTRLDATQQELLVRC